MCFLFQFIRNIYRSQAGLPDQTKPEFTLIRFLINDRQLGQK